MLDVGNSREMTETIWHSLPQQAKLPGDIQDYWGKQGPIPVFPDSRRRHRRLYLRGKAIAHADRGELAIYLKDVSRMGIGFYSPVELYPCDQIRLELSEGRELMIKVTRCMRLGDRCFECGTVFTNRTGGFKQ